MILAPQKIKMINIGDIKPNPYQTRRFFDRKSLEKLSESIKEVGILSPVIVRHSKNGYEIICGQRRLRAASMLGYKEIPAIVVYAGDRQCAQLSIIENVQRENLTVFEEAESYYNFLCYHKLKKEQVTEKLSVDAEKVSDKIKLMSLSSKMRFKIEQNLISEKVAAELIKIRDEEKQSEIVGIIAEEELSLKESLNLIKETARQMMLEKNDKKKTINLPLCLNTVKKTVDLLKKNGAKVDFEQNESEKYIEFNLKISK